MSGVAPQLELNTTNAANEVRYTEVQKAACTGLSKALQIQGAIATYYFKLRQAAQDFEQELKTIEDNFNKMS